MLLERGARGGAQGQSALSLLHFLKARTITGKNGWISNLFVLPLLFVFPGGDT